MAPTSRRPVTGRSNARRHMELETRMFLIEGDMDASDAGLARVGQMLNKILYTLVGLLVSVTTAAILLALNLVVGQ